MDIQSASIIPGDGFISINGEGYSGCEIDLDPHDRYGAIHAIQWWGDHGHVEHARGPAIGFTDVDKVAAFLDAWRARRSEVLRLLATHYETQRQSAQADLAVHQQAIEDINFTLANDEVPDAARQHIERVRDDVNKRIEHFSTLLADLTKKAGDADAVATEAEKEVA